MNRTLDPSPPTRYDGVFDFEYDFGGDLRCIPMSVRQKLDATGIKLTLKQWNRIPEDGRRALLAGDCDTAPQLDAYRRQLERLIAAHTGTPVEHAEVDPAPPWADATRVPERVSRWAVSVGVMPPTAAQWAALSSLQRFALFKLTRPGHKNENFVPAMREFGVLP